MSLLTLDDASEGVLEVVVEAGVDDGVEQRVEVAEPVGGGDEVRVDAVRLAERSHHVDDVERRPAHDDAERDGEHEERSARVRPARSEGRPSGRSSEACRHGRQVWRVAGERSVADRR